MNLQRTLGLTACAVVITGVVLAFVVIGTPGHARIIALDERRVRDLQTIALRLHERYDDPPHMPEHLPPDIPFKDPATQQPYEYHRIDAKTYTLCAAFGAPSERDSQETPLYPNADAGAWRHASGRTCYTLDVTRSTISPQRR
jgi:hypothetical protein